MRRLCVVLAALALAFAVLPAAAAAPTVPVRAVLASGAQQGAASAHTVGTSGLDALVTQALGRTARGSGTVVAELGSALRRFLAERGTLAAPFGADAEVVEVAMVDGVWTWASSAGDLTGDGLDDVLVTVDRWEDGEPDFSLETRRGSDGAALWAVPLEGWATAWPAGDLTGDGRSDLLVWALAGHSWDEGEDCGMQSCDYWVEEQFTWTVGARSGRTGAVLWEREYPGLWRVEGTSEDRLVEYESTFTVTSVNGFVLPDATGDIDGDGLPDLTLNAIDATYRDHYHREGLAFAGSSEGSFDLIATTTGEVVRGLSGAPLLERRVEDAPTVGFLEPLGEASTELLWSAATEPTGTWSCRTVLVVADCSEDLAEGALTLEVVDGTTGATRWTRTWADLTYAYPTVLAADLDADGRDDLALTAMDDRWEATIHALSGGTGETLWSRPGWASLFVAGELGGAPGDDLHVVDWSWDSPFPEERPDEVRVAVDRVDGANGATLFSAEHAFDQGDADSAWAWVFPARDVTGDGVTDLLWELERAWWSEPDCDAGMCWYAPDRTETEVLIERGRNGSVLHRATYDRYVSLWPAGDHDGDGANEVFVVDWAASHWEVLRPRTGATLWERTLPGYGWLTEAGDQTGDGVADVLASTVEEAPAEVSARVGGLDGPTGTVRWIALY